MTPLHNCLPQDSNEIGAGYEPAIKGEGGVGSKKGSKKGKSLF